MSELFTTHSRLVVNVQRNHKAHFCGMLESLATVTALTSPPREGLRREWSTHCRNTRFAMSPPLAISARLSMSSSPSRSGTCTQQHAPLVAHAYGPHTHANRASASAHAIHARRGLTIKSERSAKPKMHA